MRTLFVIIAFAGCTKTDPLFCEKHPDDSSCKGTDGGSGSDGGGSDSSTIDARTCVGTGTYAVCLEPTPVDQKVLTAGITIDTSTSTLCTAPPAGWEMAGQPGACFITAGFIDIPDLTIVGPKPIVFVSTGMIKVSGVVDAASHSAGTTGAGANLGCVAYVDNPLSSGTGGGGGAGGTFRTLGGNGGIGAGANNSGGSALDPEPTAPTTLHGGCNGQKGGAGQDGGTTGGNPGNGGGVLVLIAGGSISFAAGSGINVSGAGGQPGSGKYAGAGGGGSGGMIVLNAQSIAATGAATLMANGGAGASGNGNGAGTAGADPSLAAPTTAAMGGAGNQGGVGGNGFAGTSAAQPGGNGGSSQGGGGGGGGGGYIQTNQMQLPSIATSPAATYVP